MNENWVFASLIIMLKTVETFLFFNVIFCFVVKMRLRRNYLVNEYFLWAFFEESVFVFCYVGAFTI
jgi:hypothetical protein